MNRYLGITIGPVLRSLMMGVRPKELFTASYIHSLLSKTTIITLLDDYKVEARHIISPAFDPNVQSSDKQIRLGVGMYPDRIFVEYGENNRIDDLLKLREAIMTRFMKALGIADVNKQNFIKHYFKIYMIELDAEKGSEAVQKLNVALDNLELHNVTPAEDWKTRNVVEDIIISPSDTPVWKDAFTEKAYIGNGKVIPFPSLEELALCREEEVTQCYHKYVCVVQADGDNMGKLISNVEQLADKPSVSEISQDIFDFCKVATHIIRTGTYENGISDLCNTNKECIGLPIYAGGDDLLFIAPVVYTVKEHDENGQEKIVKKTIFDMLKCIDEAYSNLVAKNRVIESDGKSYTTHMSYGISIAYYKRPLYESLADARNQLFKVAKNAFDGKKNCIAWKLTKHSGSTHAGVVIKGSSVYDSFIDLLGFGADEEEKANQDILVSAVSHKIKNATDLMPLFHETGNTALRLQAFFDNVIDADEDLRDKGKYIDNVKALLLSMYETSTDDLAKRAYDLLRTAKFICGLDELHEK